MRGRWERTRKFAPRSIRANYRAAVDGTILRARRSHFSSSCSRCILHIRSGATQKCRACDAIGTDAPDNIITNKGHADIKINGRARRERERERATRRATRRDRARETCL